MAKKKKKGQQQQQPKKAVASPKATAQLVDQSVTAMNLVEKAKPSALAVPSSPKVEEKQASPFNQFDSTPKKEMAYTDAQFWRQTAEISQELSKLSGDSDFDDLPAQQAKTVDLTELLQAAENVRRPPASASAGQKQGKQGKAPKAEQKCADPLLNGLQNAEKERPRAAAAGDQPAKAQSHKTNISLGQPAKMEHPAKPAIQEETVTIDVQEEFQRAIGPEGRANCFSRVFFTWVIPTVNTAQKKILDDHDIPHLEKCDEAQLFAQRFKKEWQLLLDAKGPPPTMAAVVIKIFKANFIRAGLFKLVHDIFAYLSPVLLYEVVEYIQAGKAKHWDGSLNTDGKGIPYGYLLVALLALGQVVQSLCLNAYFHRMYRMGMNIRSTVISAVYEKSLKISMAAEHDTSTGQIVNLMSNDATRMQMFMAYVHNIWSAPFQIIAAFALLLNFIGPSSLVGLVVMILTLPTKKFLLTKIGAARKTVVNITDSRVKLINDVLQGIKVIKFYGWEGSFLDEISRVRAKEMTGLRKYILLESVNNTMWNLTPMLVSLSVFILYAYTGGDMKASLIFTAVFLFARVRFPVIMLPFILSSLVDFSVAGKRISDFLNKEEVAGLGAHQVDEQDDNTAVRVSDASFVWRAKSAKKADEKQGSDDNSKTNTKKKKGDKKKNGPESVPLTSIATDAEQKDDVSFTLKNINLTCKKGQLVAVVGSVGSGKSSLVSAVLGEMEKTQGSLSVSGSVAYVAQIPWIQNTTVRDNVLFGSKMDKDRYDKVVEVSCLGPDLKQLPSGDQTMIGERGINLSGGQKQRVALARALYADRDIYILDDPLSALDVHVSDTVFHKLIKGMLKTKTVLLVTHHLDLLSQCDSVVLMKEGSVHASGTFKDLLRNNPEFKDLMQGSDLGDEKDAARASSRTSRALSKTVDEDAADKKKEVKAEVIKAEERAEGSVKYSTIQAYARAFLPFCCPSVTILFTLILYGSGFILQVASSYWLAHWSSEIEDKRADEGDNGYFLGIYTAWTTGALFWYTIASFFFSVGAIGASTRLHKGMLEALLRAPMWWFDITPSGRTLNRCSKDVDEADSQLRQSLQMMIRCVVQVLSTLALITFVTGGYLGIALVPILSMYYYMLQLYRRTSRELQRLDSVSKSPIFNNFSETLQGLSSVRAFGKQSLFYSNNLKNIDANSRNYFMLHAANRWLSVRLEVIGAILTLSLGVFLIYIRFEISKSASDQKGTYGASEAALAGLALSYMSEILNTLNWGVRQVSEVETRLNSVERLLEYQGEDFPREAASELPDDPKADEAWPTEGKIDIKDLELRYRDGLPLALAGLTMNIPAGSSVGICGRTGSGKSSLMVSLFRLTEKAGGSVVIDGRDIHNMGLQPIRSRMAIIPQDPVLFLGSIRSNLDPFSKYTDQQLWEALKTCQMEEAVKARDNMLDTPVAEGGSNFSMGERQLLCITRAMLRKPKLLLLDEATASIDRQTDSVIQEMLRTVFASCTTLIIAHRLNTIMDCSHIAVIDQGKCVEFGSVQELSSTPGSQFKAMVDASASTRLAASNMQS